MLWARNRQAEVKEPGVRERKMRSYRRGSAHAVAHAVPTLWPKLCPRDEEHSNSAQSGPEQLVRNQITFCIFTYLFTPSFQLVYHRNIQFSQSMSVFTLLHTCCKNIGKS
jgi:hypothetical protein